MIEKIFLQKHAEKELKGVRLFGLSQTKRVQENAEKLMKGVSCSKEIIEAAVLLHNIGARQFLQFNQDLEKTNTALAKRILSSANIPKKMAEEIMHCVQEAHLKGEPKTVEAKIVHDAFLLDETGAIGIAKDSIVFSKQKKSLNDFLQSVKAKSLLLNNAFSTEKGKVLSKEKTKFYACFAKHLEKQL